MKSILLVLTAVAVVAVAVVASEYDPDYTPAANADKITSLPGLKSPAPFNQFAGYLTVDAAHNRKLFYWFVESQNKPSTDPIVWWSNGRSAAAAVVTLHCDCNCMPLSLLTRFVVCRSRSRVVVRRWSGLFGSDRFHDRARSILSII